MHKLLQNREQDIDNTNQSPCKHASIAGIASWLHTFLFVSTAQLVPHGQVNGYTCLITMKFYPSNIGIYKGWLTANVAQGIYQAD